MTEDLEKLLAARNKLDIESVAAIDGPSSYDLEDLNMKIGNQIGGTHYQNMAIQPTVYCELNGLSHLESSVVKYISRHRAKGGRQDLQKAIHCIEALIALVYDQ